ncbi:MAG TPA: hypothetical protein VFE24_13110, partial [Pirellulales bacterium]|nr:hypothetical protein [Pirellulales bacterium]
EVRDLLYEDLYDKKLHIAMSQQYDSLKENSQIDNYLTGSTHAPKKKENEVQQAGGTIPGKGLVTPTVGHP